MCLYRRYAKGYLNYLYDVDTNVDVKPDYCSEYSKNEVLECFIAYRNVVVSIFTDMANNDLFSHISKAETDRDTVLLPIKGIFALLHTIGSKGNLINNHLFIDSNVFITSMKKVKRKYIHTAHSILKDFGFLFEGNIWGNQGFNVYYPDNHKVLYGLYSFAHTLDYDIKSTIPVNMRFATMDSRLYTFSPQDEKQISVLDELFRFVKKDSEKEAIRLFHNQMIDKGYTYRLTVDLFDSDDYNPGICIRYDSAVYEPRAIIRANTTSKTSAIGIWLTDLGKQSEYIQSQSNVFKDSCTRLFDDCSNITCKYKKNHDKCKGKLLYTLDTVAHRKCTYKTAWGHIGNNTLFQLDKDEIDAYLYLIDNYSS